MPTLPNTEVLVGSVGVNDTLSKLLDRTLGVTFIGLLITVLLYGVTCTQTVTYFRNNARDSISLKLFIFGLWVLDTLHMSFIASSLYYYMVKNFGNVLAAMKVVWMLAAMVVISAVIEFAVRCVFIIRIWKLSDRNRPMVVIMMILNIAVLVVASQFAYKAIHTEQYVTLFDTHEWVMYTAFSLDSIIDIAITGAIAVFLWRKRTGFASTDGVMMTMIKFAINTGLLTSLISIMVLVTFVALPGYFVFMAFYFPLAPVFLNSLLITLNAREFMLETARGEAANKWSNGITHRSGEEYRLGQLGKSPTFVSQTKSAGGESFIAVTVERTTYETTDEAEPPMPKRKTHKVAV